MQNNEAMDEPMTGTQVRNEAWFLPRPKPDHYKGGMPLHCEGWLLKRAAQLLGRDGVGDITVLNLFCGMNKYGFRVDVSEEVKPDLVCDVHELGRHHTAMYDVVLADPPYSSKEARNLYGTKRLKYAGWAGEAIARLKPQGILIVYHKFVMPNPAPELVVVAHRVFVGNRAYHTPRAAIYFQLK